MKKSTATLLALALTLSVGWAVKAYGPDNFKPPEDIHAMFSKGFQKLNLSDAQKKQAANILKKYKPQAKADLEDLAEKRTKLAQILSADHYDEASLREAFRKVMVLEENSLILKAQILTELKSLLTPTQKATADQLHTEMIAKMKNLHETKMLALGRWIEAHAEK